MGKSIKGKELGKGITQRKSDGLYQERFVNRFGKTQTIYASNLNELRKKMREEQYEDEKAINVVTKDVTLDEWYEIWMNTCKKNCRNSTKESYATHYKQIQKELGWRKLTSLNLIIMQNALNGLVSDNARKNTKRCCIRHTFATRAIENGMQPKTLQKILGHGSLQMTMDLYCHVTEDTMFTEMKKMEKAS